MALGVQRGKFGDILIKDKRVQFFACEEISDYLFLNVQSIGKAAVHLAKMDLEGALVSDNDWSEETITRLLTSVRYRAFRDSPFVTPKIPNFDPAWTCKSQLVIN